MENTKTTEPTPIINVHGVKIFRVNLKENPSSKKSRVYVSNNNVDDNKVIEDVVLLKIIVLVDVSITKSKATDSKNKKASNPLNISMPVRNQIERVTS